MCSARLAKANVDKLTISVNIPLELILTCEACPEQYDVMLKGVEVGYLRLRHGIFYAQCPSVGGETVYEVMFEDGGSDGVFDEADRAIHIPSALLAISRWVTENRKDLL